MNRNRARQTVAAGICLLLTAVAMPTTWTSVPPVLAAVSDCNAGSGGGVFALGDGSSGDPYHVSNSVQLAAIGTADCLDEHYVQDADIALTGSSTPIGSSVTPFTGTYDGDGHAITGLAVTGTSHLGLFGAISNSTIQSLDITGTVSASSTVAGLLAGAATTSHVSHVSVDGTVTGTSRVGGLIGEATGPIVFDDVVNSATVSATDTGEDRVGGLIGFVTGDATIANSINNGSISSAMTSGGARAGAAGFIGQLTGNASISGSTNSGRIEGSNDAGGFVGQQVGNLIADQIVNTGVVTTALTNAGGFAARVNGNVTITNSSNVGDVTAGSSGGGFVGNLYQDATITDSVNNGDVTGGALSYIGGFIGLGNVNIVVAGGINNGDVIGGLNAGGLVGLIGGNATLTDTLNHGDVTSSAASSEAGGLVGSVFGNAVLAEVANTGDVAGGRDVGGLVGFVNAGVAVNASVNHGNVTGTQHVGGIVSRSVGGSTLLDVYSTGSVSASAGSAGGIAATLGGDLVTNAYASGSVVGSVGAGALVAVANASMITGGYFDSTLSSTSSGPGIDTDLTRLSTFTNAGWAVQSGWSQYAAGVKVWGVCSRVNSGRPFLLWEHPTDPCLVVVPTPPTVVTLPADPNAISRLVPTAQNVFVVASNAPIDAVLAASAGGVTGGLVLTADFDRITSATLAEITRLDPERIVLVGGEDRLSIKVQEQLQVGFAGTIVERVAGVDRYETAVAVSRRFHPAGASNIFVVASDAHADAVVAAAQRSPVLLAQDDAVHDATLREIERLAPEHIVVVGGTERVSDLVMTKLGELFSDSIVQRQGGDDRYDTSALLANRALFGILLVNGELESIEAYVAPAVAMMTGRMLVLSRPSCAPSSVGTLLANRSIVMIGLLGISAC